MKRFDVWFGGLSGDIEPHKNSQRTLLDRLIRGKEKLLNPSIKPADSGPVGQDLKEKPTHK